MNGAGASSGRLRLAAVLVFAGLPALLLALAGASLSGIVAGRARIAESRTLLAALSARLDVLDPEGRLDTSRLYLDGATASLAAADLRTRLVAAIAEAGGRLAETRGVDLPPEGEPNAVLLGASFDIDNAGLARLLRTLEAGMPLIEVASLALRRTDAENRGEDPALRAEIVVKAFRKVPA